MRKINESAVIKNLNRGQVLTRSEIQSILEKARGTFQYAKFQYSNDSYLTVQFTRDMKAIIDFSSRSIVLNNEKVRLNKIFSFPKLCDFVFLWCNTVKNESGRKMDFSKNLGEVLEDNEKKVLSEDDDTLADDSGSATFLESMSKAQDLAKNLGDTLREAAGMLNSVETISMVLANANTSYDLYSDILDTVASYKDDEGLVDSSDEVDESKIESQLLSSSFAIKAESVKLKKMGLIDLSNSCEVAINGIKKATIRR